MHAPLPAVRGEIAVAIDPGGGNLTGQLVMFHLP